MNALLPCTAAGPCTTAAALQAVPRAGRRSAGVHVANATSLSATAVEPLQRTVSPADMHPAIAELGRVAFSVTPSGLLFPYYTGVFQALSELGLLREDTYISGSSGGALAAALTAGGLSSATIMAGNREAQEDMLSNGSYGRIKDVIDKVLNRFLPEDVHRRASGRLGVAITVYEPGSWPGMRGELIQDFTSKQDLIDCVNASCHIPFWGSGSFGMQFRGELCNDGLTSAFFPELPQGAEGNYDTKVTVCSVPKSARLWFEGEPDISPDLQGADPLLTPFEYIGFALAPAPVERLEDLFMSGYNDTRTWCDNLILDYERKQGSA